MIAQLYTTIYGEQATEPTKEQLQQLLETLSKLPDDLFYVLFHHYHKGKGLQEIAAELSRPITTIERWKLHGEKMLRIMHGVDV